MPLHRIAMNVISMMHEIHAIPNPMIGETALPNLALSSENAAEFVRIGAFDQLDGTFDCHIDGGSQQEMHVLGHNDKGVQFISAFASILIERLQENPGVGFDDEQFAAIPSRKSREISSGRGDEASRFQGRTSAAESRTSLPSLNWHEWNSCPSRWFYVRNCPFWEHFRSVVGTQRWNVGMKFLLAPRSSWRCWPLLQE